MSELNGFTKSPDVVDCKATMQIGFLLLPEYTLSTLSNAVSVLRMANRLSGKDLYRYTVFSLDGNAVTSSAGLQVSLDGGFESAKNLDILIVCGGYNIHRYCDGELKGALRSFAKTRIPMGGMCTGSYALAMAGLLDGYRSTIHWENLASMRENFPKLDISNSLFVIDRDRYTCSGGISSIDLMLNLVGSIHGSELIQQISEQFTCDRIRSENDSQRAPLQYLIGGRQPKLVEAVSLMEANIEEPLNLDVLADCVGVSRRQLERLFNRYLHRAPSRYYMELRLSRARLLLLQTSLPLIDVAISCGFTTAPHFSKCYSDVYGRPPSNERRMGT